MKKIRIGVMGIRRGISMVNFCKAVEDVELVAVCDQKEQALLAQKENFGDGVACYTNFDDFIRHDMDAVALANYATEHAPFAIRAMRAGMHVYSEVLPVQTMKEAVELCEAVEETGKVYAYAENYCYMAGPYEMRRLYRAGKLGEFEYGEGEYIHNGEVIWPAITYGEEDHWRNRMYATFYCTHSLGPILHITGLRPVSVTGFEGTQNARCLKVGAKGGLFGVEMVTLENGGIVKSIHGDLYRDSVWYSVYGSKGRMETARSDAMADGTGSGLTTGTKRLYVNLDDYEGEYGKDKLKTYLPEQTEAAKNFGHSGSDFYAMLNFIKAIRGEKDADIIDVYEALDMFLPGLFAYRSILDGGRPKEIPNMRDKAARDAWRNDVACTDPAVAGDQLLPTCSTGTPEIPPEVYEAVRREYLNRTNGAGNRKLSKKE